MRKIRTFLVFAVCICMVSVFTGCGLQSAYNGVDFSEYIKLGKYKGLETGSRNVSVSEKEVESEIQQRLEAAAETETVEKGTVGDGDTVTVDYVGKIGGKEFEGGTAKDAAVTIGSGQFIDGFEEGLIGMKVGDSKKLSLTFPEDYSNTKVAGKDVVFDVTVKSKQVTAVPKLDDDFVKKNSKYDTVKEYRDSVKKKLRSSKKQALRQEQKDALWQQVTENAEMKKDKDGKEVYPEEQLDSAVERLRGVYEDYAKQSGLELADFLQQQMGMTEKEFNKEIRQQAKYIVKEELIIFAIADAEDIKISGDDYKAFIKSSLASYGYTEDSFKEATGKTFEEANGGKENLITYVYRDKVLDFVLDKAKIKGSLPS